MSLKEYVRKRKFDQTPEPQGDSTAKEASELRFVVQKHAATRLHYDFRLEMDGVLRSWAVPKGPSLNPTDQRLAVKVEDHPMDYGGFEGIIPKGNYGAGTVMIWDAGTFRERNSPDKNTSEEALKAGLVSGRLTLLLSGKKLKGEFALIRIKDDDAKNWLLIKKRDAEAAYIDITTQDRSVATGRTMAEIKTEAPAKGEVWLPGTGAKDPAQLKPEALRSEHPPVVPQKKRQIEVPTIESATVAKVEDARSEALPKKIRPMMPIEAEEKFVADGWACQIVPSGTRCLIEVRPPRIRLYSRQYLPFDRKFPGVARAAKSIEKPLLLDGVVDSSGVFYALDILHLAGKNLRDLPLRVRSRILEANLTTSKELRFVPLQSTFDDTEDEGSTCYARHLDAPYREGVQKAWIKFMTPKAQAKRHAPKFTNMDKILWRDSGYTKADLIDYYRRVSPYILPHLCDRPQSLHRHPHGIDGESFFQKDMLGYLPGWVETVRIESGAADKTINYALCQNEETLLYLANLGCIELNPWISRRPHYDHPDYSVIDLDPDNNSFDEVVAVAQEIHKLLASIAVKHYCKTSGATGLHILVPLGAKYSYDQSRRFAHRICQLIHPLFTKNTSLERSPAKRRNRIYLDFMQNRRGQTLAAPYCLRPRPDATVATPLEWSEVEPGLRPTMFTIKNIFSRLEKKGDLLKGFLEESIDLDAAQTALDNISI